MLAFSLKNPLKDNIVDNLFKLYLRLSQIKVHFLIGRRKSFKVISSHSVELNVERATRFQVPVNFIFNESIPLSEREKFRELFLFEG